jgi:ankyrin repeat protein
MGNDIVNVRVAGGITPLHVPVKRGHVGAVSVLVKMGGDAHALRGRKRKHPVTYCCL